MTLALLAFGAAAQAASRPTFPAGPPQAETIRFQLAIYYLTAPKASPLDALRSAVKSAAPGLVIVSELPAKPASMLVQVHAANKPQKNYPPPDEATLAYFGRGVNQPQGAQLQKSPVTLILTFAHPNHHALQALHQAYLLAGQLARAEGALIFDVDTHDVYSAVKWQEQRLASWTDAFPDAAKSITIHAYKKDEQVRAISLGMSKFGLPDLVVEQFEWSSNVSMGNLINVTAQTLVEGIPVGQGGRFSVDLNAIKNKAVRTRELASLKPKAKAIAIANFVVLTGARDEGDPHNRLAEIAFSIQPGPDLWARQDALLSTLYGSSDSIAYIRHDDHLKAASALARRKLSALQADFARGLRPGEYIEVKAPFATDKGGQEWMWVEVRASKDKAIEGKLSNEPFNITALRAGQLVKVNEDDVFDYIRTLPDGSGEGNTTGEVIKKTRVRQNKPCRSSSPPTLAGTGTGAPNRHAWLKRTQAHSTRM